MTTKKCRRCSECEGHEHHWIDDCGDDDDLIYEYACKHCGALGVECISCCGEGVLDDEDEKECDRCWGEGVVEMARLN